MATDDCGTCKSFNDLMEADTDFANYFIGIHTDPKKFIGKVEAGFDDKGSFFIKREEDEITLSMIGRICYNLHLGPYGNYKPDPKPTDYEYTSVLANAKWTLAINQLDTDDEAFSKARNILQELDQIIYKKCMDNHTYQDVQLNQSTDKNGAIKLMTKIVIPGHGKGRITNANDPELLLQTLLKEKKHDLNIDNYPQFRRFTTPESSLDYINIKRAEFTRGSYVLATFTAVPYCFKIKKDSQISCGMQFHLDNLTLIHTTKAFLSPTRKRIKDIFGNKGRKLSQYDAMSIPSISARVLNNEGNNQEGINQVNDLNSTIEYHHQSINPKDIQISLQQPRIPEYLSESSTVISNSQNLIIQKESSDVQLLLQQPRILEYLSENSTDISNRQPLIIHKAPFKNPSQQHSPIIYKNPPKTPNQQQDNISALEGHISKGSLQEKPPILNNLFNNKLYSSPKGKEKANDSPSKRLKQNTGSQVPIFNIENEQAQFDGENGDNMDMS